MSNIKQLRTDHFDNDIRITWREWVRDKRPYWLRRFIRKFNRWWRYTLHLWKENPWNEYETLVGIISLQLTIMAEDFERKGITMSSTQDAKDMRKVACLLQRFTDEYYSNTYYKEGKIEEPMIDWNLETIEEYFNRPTEWKEGYSNEGWVYSHRNNERALEIACKLIAHKLPGWWQ